MRTKKREKKFFVKSFFLVGKIQLHQLVLAKGSVPLLRYKAPLRLLGEDFDKTVFAFIPNTAETAYYGFLDGLRLFRRQQVRAEILEASQKGVLTEELLDGLIMRNWPRGEKAVHKDIKMRTFISQEKGRAQLVSHVYDITYDLVKEGDALVALDDSIVRGTTLKESIL